MTKFMNKTITAGKHCKRKRLSDVDGFSTLRPKTLDDVNDDIRLQRLLKRAVNKDFAPQSLIDAIRSGIRG